MKTARFSPDSAAVIKIKSKLLKVKNVLNVLSIVSSHSYSEARFNFSMLISFSTLNDSSLTLFIIIYTGLPRA